MKTETGEGVEVIDQPVSAEDELTTDQLPDDTEQDSGTSHLSFENIIYAGARRIVRLFQCRSCSSPLEDALTLPCGRSLCRRCLPSPYRQSHVTYPRLRERRLRFRCPFEECGREHVYSDCSLDIVLNKALKVARAEVERGRVEADDLQVSTQIILLNFLAAAPWHDQFSQKPILQGSKTVATWTLAELHRLDFDTEVAYRDLPVGAADGVSGWLDKQMLRRIQQTARHEMDCQVCYNLLHEPLTTACGHTFCRFCLYQAVHNSPHCPVCRRHLVMGSLLDATSCPSNLTLTDMIDTFWHDEKEFRERAHVEETNTRLQNFNVPLFVCSITFPTMPIFLHVFEPRYRLMIARVMETDDQTFGLVLPRMIAHARDEAEFFGLGILCRIVDISYFSDGRCALEAVGISRFKVKRYGYQDGYLICNTTAVDDVSFEEEEALEIADLASAPADCGPRPQNDDRFPLNIADTPYMSTLELMDIMRTFVERVRAASYPSSTGPLLRIYGSSPDDPATFPWWLASILPLSDPEKYKLLGMCSVRQRLKHCCYWIAEWEIKSRYALIADAFADSSVYPREAKRGY